MKRLGLSCCAALLVLGAFASCGSDDDARRVQDSEAGAGGLDGGAAGDVGSGGSSSPAAGEGGSSPTLAGAASGGFPMSGGEGGAPSSAAGVGGVLAGGAGGATFDCPAQPGNFTYSCAEIVGSWTPTFNSANGDFVLQVDSLPYPIASGTLSFFYNDADSQQCGTSNVQGVGTTAVASVALQFPPTIARITALELVDVCGGHHVFDQTGVTCNELRGTGSFGTWAMACDPGAGTCPEPCE